MWRLCKMSSAERDVIPGCSFRSNLIVPLEDVEENHVSSRYRSTIADPLTSVLQMEQLFYRGWMICKDGSENTVNHNNQLRCPPDETVAHKFNWLATPCVLDRLTSKHKAMSPSLPNEKITPYVSLRDWIISVSWSLIGKQETQGKYMGKWLNS